jgi:hypothetical protein
MAIFCLRKFKGIRVLAILALTLLPLASGADPLFAVEETAPPSADLLRLQKDLVATLQIRLKGIKEENRVGQRTEEEVTSALEDYYRELETACVMEAYAATSNAATDAQILRLRIGMATTIFEILKDYAESLHDRFNVGEITKVDVATGKAAALEAEIRLTELKGNLPANAGEPVPPCTIAQQPE